jgi:hypothetical protein
MANVHTLMAQVAPFLFPITMPIDYEPDPSKMLGARAAAERAAREEQERQNNPLKRAWNNIFGQ